MNYDDFAELYDRQYDVYRDDLHFYAGVAERVGGRVLEIGAGTGRVTAFLARRGVSVLGLEPSARMIERGQERARAEGLRLDFVQGEAGTFRLEERFALVIAPFNALMHLYTPGEQLEALQNVRQHLQPSGAFVFDLYVPRLGAMNTLRHEGETFYHPDGARTDVFLIQRHDAPHQMLTTEYFVDTTAPGGAVTRRPYTLTQRYYTRYEVEWLLRCAGFGPPRVTGSFQGGPVTEASEVMVFQTRVE
ncbi:class I SAM-dependent methyltransferase [Deinococcus hopiensis]|uniref:Methylase involved in ubiquinone/menaquinone biosynthesis n=1 Tax=Deinococcus hopiensis KR-140 TaxID=695939 RepID=A0A1W1VEB8_9DEIO|nr:class I SAM-dependent methyltransferase [Deinococcus hopiensis]SMB91401.1 Methylase involved in ubiquinone/menaquinone biosynthesis [Deinococcus hopiensis KR-140]